jgi:hypothetical protein
LLGIAVVDARGHSRNADSVISLYDTSDDIRAVQVMLWFARNRRGRRPDPFYRAAGQHLARLRSRTSREYWIELVREECRLSPRRAYELMEIAAQAKTLADLRFGKAERVRKARSKQQKIQQNQM